MIPKRLYFIWFGGILPEDNWQNIKKIKQQQPEVDVSLYIASSTLGSDELKALKEKSDKSDINLIDAEQYNNWFGHGLLKQFLKIGAKHLYVMSSDLFRIMLMVYQGGFYFDCDCGYIPQLNESILNPKYGFLQLPYDYSRAGNILGNPAPVFIYGVQASVQFHPVYILALGDIVAKFKNNPGLLECCADAPDLVTLATGQSVRIALQIAASKITNINKDWFKNNCQDLFFPQDEGENIKREIRYSRQWNDSSKDHKRYGFDANMTSFYNQLKNARYYIYHSEIMGVLPDSLMAGLAHKANYLNPPDSHIDISEGDDNSAVAVIDEKILKLANEMI